MDEATFDEIIRYHQETKHHFHRFARSLGYMDWKNQPDPIRTYQGLERVALPFLREDPDANHMDLYQRGNKKPRPFNLGTVAGFLELSLGLSAWKGIPGSQWALRINPSSGNLHPTEGHLILPELDALKGGVYHYNPLLHALEPRAEVPSRLWDRIRNHFQVDGFLVGLSSIFWRESWKYGERAFRYCNHDVGHALACLSFSANLEGWKLACLNALADDELASILGFDKTPWQELEEEHPDLLCFVYADEREDVPRGLPAEIIADFSELSYVGTPNVLSEQRVDWEIIRRTAMLAKKPVTAERRLHFAGRPFLSGSDSALPAATIIRQRRSAVAFNPAGFMQKDQFLATLDKTIPRNHCAPFDAELIEPSVNLLVFLHNVRGLEQGLYFFFRNDKDFEPMKASSQPEFLWDRVEADFPLYLLQRGDFRKTAMIVSCEQSIAGDSAFAVGMIARFVETVKKEPFKYRHLFWETGMIGQVLYLEAEAQGVRGTGIGCFFDDAVHDVLGLKDAAYQSLYHFTIGVPVEDKRLMTYPPYHHLQRA